MSDYIDAGLTDFLRRPFADEVSISSEYDLDSSIEGLPANKLNTGTIIARNLTIDLDTGTIKSRDGLNTRVYIADGVFKVSRSGFDADNAPPANLLFSSEV